VNLVPAVGHADFLRASGIRSTRMSRVPKIGRASLREAAEQGIGEMVVGEVGVGFFGKATGRLGVRA
jgi:hypothetical protein